MTYSCDSCDICARSKLHRLPFPVHEKNTSTTFELLHVDIWGPYHVKSISGGKYMLTIIGVFYQSIWIFLLA